jgi:hypothetical protein
MERNNYSSHFFRGIVIPEGIDNLFQKKKKKTIFFFKFSELNLKN